MVKETGMSDLVAIKSLLESRRLVLLLGQNYLVQPDGIDPLLSVLEQVGAQKSLAEWWLNQSESLDARAKRLDSACRSMPVPARLEGLRLLPWYCAYTTSFDSFVRRLLSIAGRREVHQRFSKFEGVDEKVLSLFRLFGSTERDSLAELPPGEMASLRAKRSPAAEMLHGLGQVVGPHGVLLIEGWMPSKGDWLRERDLVPALIAAQFAQEQVHIFGCAAAERERLFQDEDFAPLLESGIVKTWSMSLLDAMSQLAAEGFTPPADSRVTGPDTVLLRVVKKAPSTLDKPSDVNLADVPISRAEFQQLTESFRIIEPLQITKETRGTEPEQQRAFRRFLETGPEAHLHHIRSYAFRRPAYDRLCASVLKAIDSPSPQDSTVVLEGQAGSGKTTLLCLLAVELREAGFPVILVPRSVIPPNQMHIDRFAQMVEAAGSSAPVVVIWDGLELQGAYQKQSRFFASRGRKVLVIGSCYFDPRSPSDSPNDSTRRTRGRHLPDSGTTRTEVVTLGVELPPDERGVLLAHFEKQLPLETAALRDYASWRTYDNFFALLYYLFDGLRPRLQESLVTEIRTLMDRLQHYVDQELAIEAATAPKGDLQLALQEALGDRLVSAFGPDAQQDDDRSRRLLAQILDLVNAVMVASWAGLPLPVNLALRVIKEDRVAAYQRAIKAAPFISEKPDAKGEGYLSSRIPLEAEIWCQKRLPNEQAKFDVISTLVRSLLPHEARDDRTPELSFVVKLLQAIGPQGRPKCLLPYSYDNIADVITDLRQAVGESVHPRLLLVQANAIREAIVRAHPKRRSSVASPTPTHDQIRGWRSRLELAEEALLDAQEVVRSQSIGGRLGSGARSFLAVAKTERAAILGAQLHCTADLADVTDMEPDKARTELNRIITRAAAAWREALAVDNENYQPYDVACWIIRDYIDSQFPTEEERTDWLAEWQYLLEGYAEAAITPEQQDHCDGRERECAERLGDFTRAEEVLRRMIQRGSTTAHVLIARKDETVAGPGVARKYLEHNCGELLLQDRHLLLLYYRLWWQTETALEGFFPRDHLTLPFSRAQWGRLAELAEARLGQEGESSDRLAHFHLGWALLQMDETERSLRTFDQLANLSEGAFRRGRSLALVSNPSGEPRPFSGEVRSTPGAFRGRVWIDELRQEIPFNALDFEDSDRRSGASLGPFHIAMNYRGLFASPLKHFQKARK